jgi:hypothetical protein
MVQDLFFLEASFGMLLILFAFGIASVLLQYAGAFAEQGRNLLAY